MPNAEDFDDFYVSSRRRLVLQTFALTGDLGASRSAVRDAYVAARHHWNKIGRSADPESWVRPRAWATAQRRHTVRRWHKERGITPDQAAVLEGLHDLTDVQRRVLVLQHLSDLSRTDIGRELGITADRVDAALAEGTTALAEHLDCDPDGLRARLDDLDAVAGDVKLPRPPIIRRSGLRRRRNHAIVGSVMVVAITVGAGAFVAVAAPEKPLPRAGELVSKRMLLTTDALGPVTTKQPWRMLSTTDNTRGDGINTTCQGSAFADDAGLGTWVRTFASDNPMGRLVQTVEISNSPGAAQAAYDTTLGWYAGCREARIQLVDAYDVTGVGDEAKILRMRIPAAKNRSFVVGVARTGALTTSTVLETATSEPSGAATLANVLAASVRDLCESRVAGDCVDDAVGVRETLPPPSGETPGMLAIADLPAIARVNRPWVGTDPAPATTNPAATTCDNANFVKAGAPGATTRTYLIPQARLPKRFGLTETIGRFRTPKAAARFMSQVTGRMKACPDKELGSTIEHAVLQQKGYRGSSFGLWRLESQVNKQRELIAYWTGIIRNGRNVAQVTLTPVDQYDVSPETFRALIARARDRIFEAG